MKMARLPQPGGDDGNWGNVLNDYLAQAHKNDGQIKDNAVSESALAPDSISRSKLKPSVRSELDSYLDQTEVDARVASILGDEYVRTSSRIIDVRDHGAIGDGVADDSIAITLAAAAVANGTTLYFPSGTYRFAQQNPASKAAVTLTGLSYVNIVMDAGAVLLMDNLDANGLGTSDGIRIVGAGKYINLINTTVQWKTNPSDRSRGDGLYILGYPSDGAPAVGWHASTGTLQYISIINHRTLNAPQTGAVIMGCSDVAVSNFWASDTHADGLHFNACRGVTVDGHHAINVGDDGLAFVTYYHQTNVWQDGVGQAGPFNQPTIGDWNNTDSNAHGVVIRGGRATGSRIQGGKNITVQGISVRDKDFGLQINSAKIGVGNDWTSLASRNCAFLNATVQDCGSGVVVATNLIDGDSTRDFWDFSGCEIGNVTIDGSDNWSFVVETPDNDRGKVSGIKLSGITATSNNNPSGGGKGGIRLASLYDSEVLDIKLTSNHAGCDLLVVGAAQQRTEHLLNFTTLVNEGATPEDLPQSNLLLGDLTHVGPGRLLVQDIAGIVGVGTLRSDQADGEGVILNLVANGNFAAINSTMPGRGAGIGRGALITQCFNIDVALLSVNTDAHQGSLWQPLSMGEGSATYPGGRGVRIEKMIYTSQMNATDNQVAYQTGQYGLEDWYVNISWRHQGVSVPVWQSSTLGDISRVDIAKVTNDSPNKVIPEDDDAFAIAEDPSNPTLKHVTFANLKVALAADNSNADSFASIPVPATPVDFDTLITPGIYFIGGSFLNGAPTAYNQPGNTGAIKLMVTTTAPIGGNVQVIQEYISIDGADKGGQRRRWDGNWNGWQKY